MPSITCADILSTFIFYSLLCGWDKGVIVLHLNNFNANLSPSKVMFIHIALYHKQALHFWAYLSNQQWLTKENEGIEHVCILVWPGMCLKMFCFFKKGFERHIHHTENRFIMSCFISWILLNAHNAHGYLIILGVVFRSIRHGACECGWPILLWFTAKYPNNH